MGYLQHITPDNIRLWAFDDDLYFSEQDEDLLLHDPDYLPVLVELAALEKCPKQEYIKAILEYYIQWCFLYKKEIELEEIAAIIPTLKAQLSTYWLVIWAVNFQYIYSIYTKPQRLTIAACEKIAKDLIIGDYCKRDFKKLGRLVDETLEFSATTDSYQLYFYIQPATGAWKISEYTRLESFH